jgi:signal transduction histidine kinase
MIFSYPSFFIINAAVLSIMKLIWLSNASDSCKMMLVQRILSVSFVCLYEDKERGAEFMYAMEQFAQSSILLLVLLVLSIFSSPMPYLCLLFCGLLLILFAVRSLSECENSFLPMVFILVMALFLWLSDNFCAYLILYEVRLPKWKMVQTVFPVGVYGMVQIVMRERTVPWVLLGMVALAALCALLYIIEQLILRYLSAKEQMAHAVSVAAVNEMYERKLNQELVLKSYLADRNARLEERENISRNIHNSVGHSITAAIMTLDAADMLFESAPEKAREKINTANERIRLSLDSIRHAVRLLDHDGGFVSMEDFLGGLHAITEQFVMDTMIKVRIDFPDEDISFSVPHEHAEFLSGAVQEALTNGVRHGNADLFTISLAADSKHIRLTVSDNGKSNFSMENAKERIENGFGIKKLLSYTEKCGGSVSYVNEGGFKLAVLLPLYKEE